MEHLASIIKHIEHHGLMKVMGWLLMLGMLMSFILYYLPPVFKAAGEITALKIHDLYAKAITSRHPPHEKEKHEDQ